MHAAGYGKRIIPEMTVGVSAVSVAATLAPGAFPLMKFRSVWSEADLDTSNEKTDGDRKVTAQLKRAMFYKLSEHKQI